MADGPTPRKGEKVLIIFYDPVIEICGKLADLSLEHADLSKVSTEQFIFFPIRYATVIDAKSESGAHTFGLKLGSLVDYRGSEEKVDARIRDIQQQLLAAIQNFPRPAVGLFDGTTKLVHLVSNGILAQEKYGVAVTRPKQNRAVGHHAWISMARYLVHKSNSLKYATLCCYFSVPENIQPDIPRALRKKLRADRDFGQVTLLAGTSYDLVSTVISGPLAASASPAAEPTGDKALIIGQPFPKQRGPGTDIVWKLVVTESSSFQSGSLCFETKYRAARQPIPDVPSLDQRLRIAGPRMVLVWRVRPSLWSLLIPLLVVIMGLGLLHQADDVASVIAALLTDWSGYLGKVDFRAVAIHVAVRLVGAVFVAGGGIWLLQKGVSKVLGT